MVAARARDFGIVIGSGRPGPHNAIIDVPGVSVGHVTLISGEGSLRVGHGPVRTGVTVIRLFMDTQHGDERVIQGEHGLA
ncbi:P1 family peptidase [Streptosporangium sp. NPDC000396]|uniref:P1 family peptidase n=1 Tax=Streptosporangium sp. NPDC000396 TaxID=3366185 RepID=UPI0036B0ABE5